MRPVRSFEGERAFEEAWEKRDETAALVDLAHKAARRGRTEELEVCLAKLAALAPGRLDGLAEELQAICRAVRNHPSFVEDAGHGDTRRAV